MTIKKTWIRLSAGAALTGAMALAQAGTLTMHGWLYGQGYGVNVSSPNYSGGAGGFAATLDGMSDSRFNIGSLALYCVDIGEYINIANGTRYTAQMDGEAARTNFTLVDAGSLFNGDVTNRLGQLVSYMADNAGAVDSALESTAMQLAIWNTLYDRDARLDSGSFSERANAGARDYANTLLASATGWGITQDLYVLRSVGSGTQAGQQDQLLWLKRPLPTITTQLPEPSSLALAALALGGLVLPGRRKAARRAQLKG